MSQSTNIEWTDATWHEKTAAKRLGISPGDYIAHLALGEKWCTRCKIWHSRQIFPIDRSRGDGLAASCRGYKPSQRLKSPAERRETARIGYRKYYAGSGGQRIRARVYARNRNTSPISPRNRELVIDSFFGLCAYCQIRKATTIDHAIPVKNGGGSHRGNLIAACGPCNSSKNTKTLDAFLDECISKGYIPSDRIIEELCMEDVL